MTSDELKIIVNRSPPTNCDLDPVPTRLLTGYCSSPIKEEITGQKCLLQL